MKAIMISIKPEWVAKIFNGEKTIEIRKTMPKCDLPCKVYIYCTKDKKHLVAPFRFIEGWKYREYNENTNYACGCTANMGEDINGKVVAEFTLKNIVKFDIESIIFMGKEKELMQKSCLGGLSLRKYLGNKIGYAWGIDDLKIYNKPKELSEFYGAKECPYKDWGDIDNIGCWETG